MSEAAELAARFRHHAEFCDRAGAPLYRELLLGLAEDLVAQGVTAWICAGWGTSSTGEVVQLRLLAALHRLVLTGQAPRLSPFYRSAAARGPADPVADPSRAWPVARDELERHADLVRAGLDRVPQTNETGRAASLAVGLSVLAGRRRGGAADGPLPVRLLELGASAGLNLLVDRFRIEGEWGGRPWAWGPPDARLRLAGAVRTEPTGQPVPEPAEVLLVDRAGCDLAPVDPLTEEGALHLRSYVWPDHVDRTGRLEAALAVARAAGPGAAPVDRAGAADWLVDRLAEPPEPGVVTVVWHSVVVQYLPEPERWRVDQVLADARARMPVLRLCLESSVAPYTADPVVWLEGRPLAVSSAHGLPVRLGAAVPG